MPNNADIFEITLTEKSSFSPGVYLLTFDSPGFPADTSPFQFVLLAVPERPDLLLKRPFSVFNIKSSGAKTSSIAILLRVAGDGTKALAAALEGTRVSATGPFGGNIEIPSGVSIIAGGIGVAGVRRFVLANRERVRALYFGSRTAWDPRFYEGLEDAAGTFSFATDDGSLGHKGNVTDLFEPDGPVLACGPPAMLMRVHELTNAAGVPAYASFEARMACGVGACRGCALPVRPELSDGKEYVSVCRDGPVFRMDTVDWEKYKRSFL